MKVMERLKKGLRSWLNVQEANPKTINIRGIPDYELNAIRNRIWYRGDSNELQQLYEQISCYADKWKFWASVPTPGMEIRKIHSGLPKLMINTLSSIVMADLNDFDFGDNPQQKHDWEDIEEENNFQALLSEALTEILYVGDGVFKTSFDPDFSQLPIIEFYPGDEVEIIYKHSRVHEFIFKTPYTYGERKYILNEHYGYGYVDYSLYEANGKTVVDLDILPETKGLQPVTFDKRLILAAPLKINSSSKWKGRGESIFEGKIDNFDALDEAWSQWMDALRAGRSKTYIPDALIPKDPDTGSLIKPNPFDNRFIQVSGNMMEDGVNKIDLEQPSIPHDSYLTTYVTALDLCLQGIISPSTLGIDVKKLDNAEAQREKEKTTLYTRNSIIEALRKTLPDVVGIAINAYNTIRKQPIEEVKVEVPFGEYANPSFESQVETLSKARPGMAVMSIEAQVEEMWGDSKDGGWKEAEIKRLKAEIGIEVVDEPSIAGADMYFTSGE